MVSGRHKGQEARTNVSTLVISPVHGTIFFLFSICFALSFMLKKSLIIILKCIHKAIGLKKEYASDDFTINHKINFL